MKQEIKSIIENEKINELTFEKTKFEIENFVLGGKSGITPSLKLKNCSVEIKNRYYEILDLEWKIDLNNIELEKIKNEQEQVIENEILKKELELEKSSTEIQNIKYSQKIKSLEKELEYLLDIYSNLKQEVDELLKQYSKEQLEIDSYLRYFLEEINNQLLANQIGMNIESVNSFRGLSEVSLKEHIMANIKQMICESIIDSINMKDVAKKYIENVKKVNNQPTEENTQPMTDTDTQIIDMQNILNNNPNKE